MKQMTPEIKAKIFALYWGQSVIWMSDREPRHKHHVCGKTMKYVSLEHMRLGLKPLSSITDEDAIEVAKIYSDNPEYHKADRAKQKLFTFYENHWNALPVDTADLLRSKGYALPAYGFSVDELVEAGVFKLKEVNND